VPEFPAITLNTLAAAAGDLLVAPSAGDTTISSLTYDSRTARPGALFFCVPGAMTDGHEFAEAAVSMGASALMVERHLDLDVPQIVVADVRKAMARTAAEFFSRPAEDLVLLGITGTNGKTTTVFLVEAILRAAGNITGLIGTIETRVAGERRAGLRTTPESLDLQALLADMRDHKVDTVVMEVTSHGLVLNRVEGLRFKAAAFTNLTQDHLDFHRDMEDYFQAKRSLFVPSRVEVGAANVDDPYGRKLKDSAEVPCIGFGTSSDADVRASGVELTPTGTRFVAETGAGDLKIESALVGSFNLSNCLAAISLAIQAGIEPGRIEAGIGELRSVPGRFESVAAGQPYSVVVDYAHTPDSLDNVLRAARRLARHNSGRVICIFGCGGDRDRGKRPLMGAVAARLADVVVVTSDNPRSEAPATIIGEILQGVATERPHGADVVVDDRREAIARGLGAARAGDVVVIAGKGHETGQQFAHRTIPFDDRVVAREVLAELGWGAEP
jgi:UDP-N-acetylmuramoyl-L-alanyl-D-glutamate--2,6-diaminopimelate ligase